MNINEVAVKYISRSKKTENELKLKLLSLKYSNDEIEKCIDYMKELGYIDDEDYVKRFLIQNSRLKKYSRYELKIKLLQKGVNKDIISQMIDTYITDKYEIEVINHIVEVKKRVYDEDKLKKYLLNRGFKGELIDGDY